MSSTAVGFDRVLEIETIRNLNTPKDLHLMRFKGQKKSNNTTTTRVTYVRDSMKFYYSARAMRNSVSARIQKELEQLIPERVGLNAIYHGEVETTWGTRKYIITVL